MSKKINLEALKQLGKNADVQENTNTTQTQQVEKQVFSRRRLLGKRKVYRTFSLSLIEEDYFKFQNYLDENQIPSGSEFLRDLLRERGII